MRITIQGAEQTPTWDTLQDVVRQALKREGRLTRISRPDGQCSYRDVGVYELTFTPDSGDETRIAYEVSV